MLLVPLPTPRLSPGDNLARLLQAQTQPGDILVVASKAIATMEGAFIDLPELLISKRARSCAEKTGRTSEFCQAVLQELKRLNGIEKGACPGAILTELRPEGLARGTILVPNAGLDESNAPKGKAIGWPQNPVLSISRLRSSIKEATGNDIAVILSDSVCYPRRQGVTAIALAVSGFDPIADIRGTSDIYGKKLSITTEAVADQLATAANALMGNGGQSIPAVIVRGHGVPLSSYEGWVEGVEGEKDLFGLL